MALTDVLRVAPTAGGCAARGRGPEGAGALVPNRPRLPHVPGRDPDRDPRAARIEGPDVLGANLDVLLRFIEGSGRGAAGRLPVTLSHGGSTVAIVYGRWAYLAVVLEGEPDEILVREMRHGLEAFEATNAPVLADWNGDMTQRTGPEALVGRLYEGTPQA